VGGGEKKAEAKKKKKKTQGVGVAVIGVDHCRAHRLLHKPTAGTPEGGGIRTPSRARSRVPTNCCAHPVGRHRSNAPSVIEGLLPRGTRRLVLDFPSSLIYPPRVLQRWAGAADLGGRAVEFRQIHLGGEIPPTTPSHQTAPLRMGRARRPDQVPPKLTLQRNLPYNETHPTTKLTLQRNSPYNATHPTTHLVSPISPVVRPAPHLAVVPPPHFALQQNLPYTAPA
jgi:hypothetical protein